MKVTYSSELISNFKLADIAAPDKQFAALQTDKGCSLLFSLSTENALFVTEETPGHATGWVKTPLSAEVVARHSSGLVKAFAVAQNAGNQKLDLAMVVSATDGDHLYLSLGNAADNTSWAAKPTWVAVTATDKLSIAKVFISQAADGQYIVVDRVRNPGDSQQFVARYHIDTARLGSADAWQVHGLPVDLEIDHYSSCLGRRGGEKLDGIYTLGHIGSHDTLVYQALYDRFNPGQPTTAVRLNLPANSGPTALASALINEQHETDLYVAGKGALYYFPSGSQQDGAEAIKVVSNSIFEDVHQLHAFTTDHEVIVWGLNRAQQLFHTSCPRASVATASAWSFPLPILAQVQGISPYINRANSGQVFFAHIGSGQFQKASRTLDGNDWHFDNILLPVLKDSKTKAKKFSSYTTRIQVTDDSNRPLGNPVGGDQKKSPVTVSLSAAQPVGLYINNHYYLLAPTPIDVPVDATGGLMIVEWVDGLAATELQIHSDGKAPVKINPMNKPLQQAAQLDSDDKVAKAVVRKANGEVEKSLMGKDATGESRAAFVEGMHKLASAHQGLQEKAAGKHPQLMASAELTRLPLSSLSVGSMLTVSVSAANAQVVPQPAHLQASALKALGAQVSEKSAWAEFVLWLKSLAEYVVHLIEDVVNKVWHFVVEVAGKIFRFVLDAVVKVAGALETAFQWIKTAVEDVVKFLSFLFAWDDIVRTKNVFKQLAIFSVHQAADDLGWIKTEFDKQMKKATDSLDDWAGLSHSSDWLKKAGSEQSLAQRSSSTDLQSAHSTPSQYLTHHFNSNVHNSEVKDVDGGGNGDLTDLLKTVLHAFEQEGEVFSGLVTALKEDVFDQFDTLPVAEILKRIVVRLVDALALTTKVIGDTVFDLLAQLMRTAIRVLDAKVYIPVVSEILEDVFGLAPFSILDVLCLIGAVPATIIYKIATGEAPFSANDRFSDKVIKAQSLEELRASFAPAQPLLLTAGDPSDGGKTNALPIVLDAETQRRLFISGHAVSGIIAIFVLPIVTFGDVDMEEGTGYSKNPFSAWATLAGILSAGSAGYARIFADPHPIKHEVFSAMSIICTGCTLVSKVIHGAAGAGYYYIGGDRKTEQFITKLGSFFDCLFAIVSLVPTCYHFYELSELDASDDRSAAILGETSSICSYLARIAEFGARMSKPGVPKLVLMIGMGGLYVCYGVLQCAEAGVGGKPLPPATPPANDKVRAIAAEGAPTGR